MATHTAPVMVRLTPTDRRQLQERAAAEDRKEADLARHLIRRGLQHREATGAS